jgi:hypothetical protein
LASPLGPVFTAATPDQRDKILAGADQALRGCGNGDEVRFRLTTNIATASRG